MCEALDAWDRWLQRLVDEEETPRRVNDIRACLISEISHAMFNSGALPAGDPDELREIAVDALIEFSRKV
jgi:hypothetical protein